MGSENLSNVLAQLKGGLVYLAGPYSHPDLSVRCDRFKRLNRIAGRLIKEGLLIYSPISHSHPIGIECGMPFYYEHWRAVDEMMIEKCEHFIVAQIGGWRESIGVRAEVLYAQKCNIPLWCCDATGTITDWFDPRSLKGPFG